MSLRHYQRDCLDSLTNTLTSDKSTLFVMPVGTGKTVVFAELVRQRLNQGRCLILAHRRELVEQAKRQIEHWSGVKADIEMGQERVAGKMFRSPITISTVQSQCAGFGEQRRMHGFDPHEYGTLIIDEGHHATMASYRTVIDHYVGQNGCKLVGCTATPNRSDKQTLKQVFQSCAYDYQFADARRDGWLTDVRTMQPATLALDFSEVNAAGGDLAAEQLAAMIEREKPYHAIAGAVLQGAPKLRTIIFTMKVEHAELVAEVFNRYEPGTAACVHAKTPEDVRAEIVRAFRRGELLRLCNVDVFSEGFDVPEVGCILMARPHRSLLPYAQKLGRGLRPTVDLSAYVEAGQAPDRHRLIRGSDKPHLLVIDFTDSSGRHDLCTPLDVLGGIYPPDVVTLAKKYAKRAAVPQDVDSLLHKAYDESQCRKAREAARREHVKARMEIHLEPFRAFGIPIRESYSWGGTTSATDKQAALLRKFKVENAEELTKAQASELIGAIFDRQKRGLCTFGQAKWVRKFGHDPENMAFAEAKAILDRRFKRR